MSFHTVNGQNAIPGFNNYRYGCGRSQRFGYNYNMSMNGSVMPNRGYCDPNRGKFIQQQYQEETEKTTWDKICDALGGVGIVLMNNGAAIGTLISNIFNGNENRS